MPYGTSVHSKEFMNQVCGLNGMRSHCVGQHGCSHNVVGCAATSLSLGKCHNCRKRCRDQRYFTLDGLASNICDDVKALGSQGHVRSLCRKLDRVVVEFKYGVLSIVNT